MRWCRSEPGIVVDRVDSPVNGRCHLGNVADHEGNSTIESESRARGSSDFDVARIGVDCGHRRSGRSPREPERRVPDATPKVENRSSTGRTHEHRHDLHHSGPGWKQATAVDELMSMRLPEHVVERVTTTEFDKRRLSILHVQSLPGMADRTERCRREIGSSARRDFRTRGCEADPR